MTDENNNFPQLRTGINKAVEALLDALANSGARDCSCARDLPRAADIPAQAASGTETIGILKAMAASVPMPTKTTPLNPWQFKFTIMTAALIAFAYLRGYTLTFGNARTDKGCTVCGGGARKPTSLHFDGLAIDLNLFKDGKYLSGTSDHEPLGEFWESIGGTWGGRFNDGNHYSLAYGGRK